MPVQILMPSLSPAMGEGTLTRWLVGVGDPVTSGTVIAEIETAAATMEIESIDDGRIARILVAAGTANVAAGTPIAELAEPARVPVSPLARRLALQLGLALTDVRGSGPNGRIVKRDVEAASALNREGKMALVAAQPEARSQLQPGRTFDIVDADRARRTYVERLTRAASDVPHAYLTLDCRLDEMLRTRARINAMSPSREPRRHRLTINDFIVKAWALALQRVPSANATWRDGRAVRQQDSDVAVAIAGDFGVGLPVIRQAHAKSLSEISDEIRQLRMDARRIGIGTDAWEGCATTISNLGMYGIKNFDSVVHSPQTTLLAVGAAEHRPVVNGDRLEIGTVMTCTLSCDQRAIDGAVSAELLAVFKDFIEDPVRMLV